MFTGFLTAEHPCQHPLFTVMLIYDFEALNTFFFYFAYSKILGGIQFYGYTAP